MTSETERILRLYFPSLFARITSGELSGSIDVIDAVVSTIKGPGLRVDFLNQVMRLLWSNAMSDGCFTYYFVSECPLHPYNVMDLWPEPKDAYEPGAQSVTSVSQFEWGIKRFIVDAMLYWGNFRRAYDAVRSLSFEEIEARYSSRTFNSNALVERQDTLPLGDIPIAKRHLLSSRGISVLRASPEEIRPQVESVVTAMCSGADPADVHGLRERLSSGERAVLDVLLDGQGISDVTVDMLMGQHETLQRQLDGLCFTGVKNTQLYLSIADDLDVYVAATMRTRGDCGDVAAVCRDVFGDRKLEAFHLRYFDPTTCITQNPADKAILECLMLKSAKILLYLSQEQESLGKAAEFAMGLSLGKPTIILSPPGPRAEFYKHIHPLTRLVEFETGVVHGALVAESADEVITLIHRLLSNTMSYELDTRDDGYYVLHDALTKSAVRVVTNDKELTKAFWRHYF